MTNEKCFTPNNVEPFSDPCGTPNQTVAANVEKCIYVYSGGQCIRNFIGTITKEGPNHFHICEGDEEFDVYDATIIVCARNSRRGVGRS